MNVANSIFLKLHEDVDVELGYFLQCNNQFKRENSNLIKGKKYLQRYLDGFLLVNIGGNVLAFVETIKGKPKAWFNAYFFNFHCILKNGDDRYQCEDYDSEGCRAFIWARNARVTKISENEHNHAPNAARIHHLQVGSHSV